MQLFRFVLRALARALTLLSVLSVCACATRADPRADEALGSTPWVLQSGVVDKETEGAASASATSVLPGTVLSHWTHYRLLGKKPTVFQYERVEGRDTLAVEAISSASMVRRKVRVAPQDLGQVRFSWNVPELIATADMGQRDFDDSAVRVVFAFDGDRSTFSGKNAMLNELTLALTGEEMPYAVLMYVWSKQRAVGEVIHSPRTDRIRKLVVESGGQNLNQWQDYERNIAADFFKLYGELPGALIGMGLMTDTDNTHTTAHAWYGPLQVLPPKLVP